MVHTFCHFVVSFSKNTSRSVVNWQYQPKDDRAICDNLRTTDIFNLTHPPSPASAVYTLKALYISLFIFVVETIRIDWFEKKIAFNFFPNHNEVLVCAKVALSTLLKY